MALIFDAARCTGCGACVRACPFGVLSLSGGHAVEGEGCRACGACVRACPHGALELPKKAAPAKKAAGFLVFLQFEGTRLLPVSLELLHAAQALAAPSGEPVWGVAVGHGLPDGAFTNLGIAQAWVYDDPVFASFCPDAAAAAVCDCVRALSPAALLFGATPEGRSIAPLVAVAFETGLTADCTSLYLDDGLLVQVRPAFGGNVMAEILTRTARPQMVTVRPGVLHYPAKPSARPPRILRRAAPCPTALRPLGFAPQEQTGDIAGAKFLLAIGNGAASKEQVALFRGYAERLGAALASSRALVEKGLMPLSEQIGLSGKAVAPELLIACGISGSVQFCAGIGGAKRIIAINSDPNAPIFSAAHEYIVGDMYELLPALLERLEGTAG